MKKLSLTLIFVFALAIFSAFAEEVEITTYYPAPSGVYKDLASEIYYDYNDPQYQQGNQPQYFLDPFPGTAGAPSWNEISLTVGGKVGIGTSNPDGKLSVVGQDIAEEHNIILRKNAPVSPSNIAWCLSHRENKKDFWIYGTDNTGSTPWWDAVKYLWDTKTVALVSGTNGGKVGIGTSNPAGILDVRGGDASAGQSGTSINIFAQNGYGNTGQLGGDIILMPGKNVSNGAITGGLGIGTTNPAGILDVEGGFAPSGTNGAGINLYSQSGNGFGKIGGNIILMPGTADWAGVPGRVGIGTTNPQGMFDLRPGQNTVGNGGDINIIGQEGALSNSTGGNIILNPGNGHFMNAPYPGRVGIGTTAPAGFLDISAGTAQVNHNGENIFIRGQNAGPTGPSGSDNGGNIILLPGTKMGSLAHNGCVGIGTLDPIYKLHITDAGSSGYDTLQVLTSESTRENGTAINAMATGTGSYGMQAYGKQFGVMAQHTGSSGYDFYSVTGSNYGFSSSIRWKKNIQPVDNPLDKIMKLRGVYFDWDKEHGGKHDLGMVGEEVGKVVPEAVVYEKDGKYVTGMRDGPLVPLLIEAVKEQQKQIDYLKKEMAELKQSKK